MLDKIIKEAQLMYAAVPSSQNLCSTITKNLQKHTDLKEELTRIWQLNAGYVV
jgi:hypothetical protein